MQSKVKIFLIEPIDAHHYKKMLILSSCEISARKSASASITNAMIKSVYLDPGSATCIEIDPTILDSDQELKLVKIRYKEIIYYLHKDEPEEVIADRFL